MKKGIWKLQDKKSKIFISGLSFLKRKWIRWKKLMINRLGQGRNSLIRLDKLRLKK